VPGYKRSVQVWFSAHVQAYCHVFMSICTSSEITNVFNISPAADLEHLADSFLLERP